MTNSRGSIVPKGPFGGTPHFRCGWSLRAQDALSVAGGVQILFRGISEIEPAYGLLRPMFAARPLRPTDPGPVLECSVEALAELLDRRARFDPPRPPAPVSAEGYLFSVGARRSLADPLSLYGRFRVGQSEGFFPNWVELSPHPESPAWKDLGQSLKVLDALLAAWRPDWAYAEESISIPPPPQGGPFKWEDRPWWIWTSEKPAMFPQRLTDLPPPSETRPYAGGELRIWPWVERPAETEA